MGQIKLSERERKILGILELDADGALGEVARALGAKTSSIQRSLQRLRDCGAIEGKTAVIDTSKLGLVEYGINLTLAPRSADERGRFIRHLLRLPRLSWLAEVGGKSDLMCNVLARHPAEVHDFMDKLTGFLPHIVVDRSIVQRTSRIRFWRGYLYSNRRGMRFRLGESRTALPISKIEAAVIKALDQLRFESFRELSAKCHLALSTFTRTVRELKVRGILAGFGLRLNTQFLAVQQFRILIRVRHLSAEQRATLERRAAEIAGVKLLVRCLGAWEYEIEFDAADGFDARTVCSELWDAFPHELVSVELVPILKHLKYISFGAGLDT